MTTPSILEKNCSKKKTLFRLQGALGLPKAHSTGHTVSRISYGVESQCHMSLGVDSARLGQVS